MDKSAKGNEIEGNNLEKEAQQGQVIMLQAECEEKDKQIKEYCQMLQRLQAEFENYKKRIEREQKTYTEQANADLVLKLLPVLDNFERALQSETPDIDAFKKGVAMIFSQLIKTLKAEGLSPINACGEEFDPYYHECVLTIVGYEDDTVIEELEKGYMFKNRVLRPSKVKVGKNEVVE
jgi:molecular chaperone GrpE